MPYEGETEYNTSYYHCIDPIENFKIRVVLKPIKNFSIPLPQFDAEQFSSEISSVLDENESDTEEYTFKWQEKIFSKDEIRKYTAEADWKRKIKEKHHDACVDAINSTKNYPKKLFTYVEVDNYSGNEKQLNLFRDENEYYCPLKIKFEQLNISGKSVRSFGNIPKKKVINYYPTDEFKNQSHIINRNVERMFIMVSFGSKVKDGKKAETEESIEYVLCALSYNYSTNVLEVTPSFSKTKLNPYTIGVDSEDTRNCYYYWLHHASSDISVENLVKETNIMSKVLDHQEELRKLQIDTDFFIGQSNHLYITLLGEIISAQDFEYDHLYVHYFLKLPFGWGCSDLDSLMGTTQTSCKNHQEVCYFSQLFEMNFFLDIEFLEELSSDYPELFLEVLSVDKCNRYRNEGYTYTDVPKNPGMYEYDLKCWRATDKTIRSQLERFFIGGGPELEDISYVGLKTAEKSDVMSRFGFETIPSGKIKLKLNVLHQSESFKVRKGVPRDTGKIVGRKPDAGSLLGSVNAVLEAFRKARERMLQAKKGLETDSNDLVFNFESKKNC